MTEIIVQLSTLHLQFNIGCGDIYIGSRPDSSAFTAILCQNSDCRGPVLCSRKGKGGLGSDCWGSLLSLREILKKTQMIIKVFIKCFQHMEVYREI